MFSYIFGFRFKAHFPDSEFPNFSFFCKLDRLRISQIIKFLFFFGLTVFPSIILFPTAFQNKQQEPDCTYNTLEISAKHPSSLFSSSVYHTTKSHNSTKCSAIIGQGLGVPQFPIICSSFPSVSSPAVPLPLIFMSTFFLQYI